MKSLTIASLASALCVLWLPKYNVAEDTEVQILKCTVENPMPGAIAIPELIVSENTITSSKLDVQQDVDVGDVSVHVLIYNEDDDVVFDQTIDLCSMSSNDMFKNYWDSFNESELNNGNCPLTPGSYSSGHFAIRVNDELGGLYKGSIEATQRSNVILNINFEAQTKQ